MCWSHLILTSQQDTVIHRGRRASLPKICLEGKNWWGHLKKTHIWFFWWLNSNQFFRLFLRSHRWMFSLGRSLLKISWKRFIFGYVEFNKCPLSFVYPSSCQRGICISSLSTTCSTLCVWLSAESRLQPTASPPSRGAAQVSWQIYERVLKLQKHQNNESQKNIFTRHLLAFTPGTSLSFERKHCNCGRIIDYSFTRTS